MLLLKRRRKAAFAICYWRPSALMFFPAGMEMISFAATLSAVHRQKRAERQSGAKAVVAADVSPLVVQRKRKQARYRSVVPSAAVQSFQAVPRLLL